MKTSIAWKRLGTEEAPAAAIALCAGPLIADFVGGGLRTIRYEGHEVLRAIAYVVRDKDWGTCSPEIADCAIHQDGSGFEVTYRARAASARGAQILEYRARISGSAGGRLIFDVTAEPQTVFLTARCGFAVLHPIRGVAGQPAVVEHADGRLEEGTFPDLIAPYQPFQSIRAICHSVAPGLSARCRMEGDVFEMEDQRNWSDASYKTYARPIALPWPYRMEQGVESRQSVELEILREPCAAASAEKSAATQRREVDRAEAEGEPSAGAVRIEVGSVEGIFPAIGIALPPEEMAAAAAHPELLRQLRPQLLLFSFNPAAGDDSRVLAGFARIARAAGDAECGLELVVPGRRAIVEELREAAAWIAESGLRFSSVMVSPAADLRATLPGSEWPACPPLADVYRAARAAFPESAIGGGMMTYFAELNRKRPPVELLDFVSHTTCAIIHAADELTVMQSLEALPYVVRSARAIVGPARGYRLGPSTIGMRQNPYGSNVMENPDNRRVPMTDRDPRQNGLFAAAWMIGYAAATVEGDLQVLTVGALTGPLGVASVAAASDGSDSSVFYRLAFHAARGLAQLAGRPRYRCRSSRPDAIAAVAGEDRDGRRVLWLANLTGERQRVDLPAGTSAGLVLDERNFPQPGDAAASGSERPGMPSTGAPSPATLSIELLPYSVASLLLACTA